MSLERMVSGSVNSPFQDRAGRIPSSVVTLEQTSVIAQDFIKMKKVWLHIMAMHC